MSNLDKNTEKNAEQKSAPNKNADSLGIDGKKSPWLVYALLQIPLVIIMVIILYFAYQNRPQTGMSP